MVQESFGQNHPSAADSTTLKIYQQLQTLNFDPTQTATIENLVFKKDRAKFVFKKGVIYFSQPIAGKITGAVFLGEGIFEFTPPNEIERYQQRRFLEKDFLSENFSAAYLRFTDDTAETLFSQLTVTSSKIPKEVNKLQATISKDLLEDLGYNLSSRILADLLNSPDEGLFFAVIEKREANALLPNYLIYCCDPQDREGVSLYQFYPNRALKPFYTLCSFPREADTTVSDEAEPVSQNMDLINIDHYKMNVKLDKNGEVQIAAEISFIPRRDSLRCIDFSLFHELEIDSVINGGSAIPFIREKKQTDFAVIFPRPLLPNKQKLAVYYRGKLLEPAGELLFLKDKVNWFPRHGYLNAATFDISFDHGGGWELVSVGQRMDLQATKKQVTSRWVQETPALTAAFAFGRLDSTRVDSALSVYSTRARSKKKRREIGDTVAKSISFFEQRLREKISSHLNVIESPGLFSQSYPGLLLLSSASFQQRPDGPLENHIGHEVSHQWWGNLVGWQTYHDQWLSEALAEYSGALLAQHVVVDDEKIFFEILEGWRNDLLYKGHIGVSLGLRRFGFSKDDLIKSQGMEAGPIWLGQRLGSKFPVDYYLIVYEKGAYVLHMLRLLLRDFATGSDDRFWEMLADFVATYKDLRATTFDFQRIVEKHVGEPMDWFFDQWVFGVEIPTYFYDYTILDSNAEYWLDLTVTQENVPPDFKMFIPVGIPLPEKKLTQLIWLSSREQSFRLGPFPEQPSKIIFNDFGGVLARVKQK